MSKKSKRVIRNSIISVILLSLAFGASIFLQKVLFADEHIATLFVFSVFVISLLTDGYAYGMIAAALSVALINFAFTFPYFAFDFLTPENFISALIMTVVSLLAGALTTRLKRWEALKAEGEREKMRANLLRAVSHDLRTPLTTIYGSSSFLLESYEALPEEQRKRMLTGIKSDSEWLIRMVENLLSVTRLEGSIGLIKTPTALEELVDSVVLKFKKRYPDRRILLSIPEETLIIPMDPILIEQVIVNILENAVIHAKGMTELSLSVRKEGERAIFEIADNGAGIEKERLESIFSGNNVSVGADAKKRNLGIGLSVCSTIVAAHGGGISAENRKEGGALFRFYLEGV